MGPFNHLAREKSPYLRQHMHNPVDWYPWGEEAFRRAGEEDKPVFVSIGYATCHWCHVMARESFEDPGVAALLNAHFISVKVDREERPDIDSVYMAVCQQMTGQGGWPLTVVLTPQKEPFFAGTYFPKYGRRGSIGLVDLLTRIARLWKEQRDELQKSAGIITAALRQETRKMPGGTPEEWVLDRGFDELAARFDPVNGGFGRAPKFPTPETLLFLFRYWKRTGSSHALLMAEQTLDALRCGGIHDHLGGGFHRYSTDAQWRVPHFEKMLYDQALLLMAFSEGWLATKRPEYRKVAEDIITYVTRDLSSPEGAFVSAEDADSPGGEGAFYTWTREEIDLVLGREDGAFAADLFGVTGTGNFSIPETGKRTNVLFLRNGDLPNPVESSRGESVRQRLLAARAARTRPQRDDKVLTDWNGLIISSLAQAYRAFGDPRYLTTAEQAMRAVLAQVRAPDGGLLHRYCDGDAAIPAFADDYAFVIQALICLYEAGFDPVWLETATELDRHFTGHFHDREQGGYFPTSDLSDLLILRKKEIYDGAIPSSNSVMLGNLVRLGHLTGDPTYEARAFALAESFISVVAQSPAAYAAFLCGLSHLLGPATDIVIVGRKEKADTWALFALVRENYLPSVTVLFRDTGSSSLDILAPFTRSMVMQDGKATAYACHGTICSGPVTRPEDLADKISRKNEKIRGS